MTDEERVKEWAIKDLQCSSETCPGALMVLAALDVERQTMTERGDGYDVEVVEVEDLARAMASKLPEKEG